MLMLKSLGLNLVGAFAMLLFMVMGGCSEHQKETSQFSDAFKSKFMDGCLKEGSSSSCACFLENLEKLLSSVEVKALEGGDNVADFGSKMKSASDNCKK